MYRSVCICVCVSVCVCVRVRAHVGVRVCVCGEREKETQRERDRERKTETERDRDRESRSALEAFCYSIDFSEYKDAAVVYILDSPCLPTFRSITFLLSSPSFLSCRCQRNPAVPTPMPGAGRQPTVFKCLPRRKKEREKKKRKKKNEQRKKKEKQLHFTYRLDRMLAGELV